MCEFLVGHDTRYEAMMGDRYDMATMTIDASQYGPHIAEVLIEARIMPLGPGSPNRPKYALLKALTVEKAFDGRRIVDMDMARAALAGLWLYHDFLDESHTISQGLSSTTGSYWHGIMHRREPDYSNAKYWFRRVGAHPVFASLHEHASGLSPPRQWDPFAFIDACEQAARCDDQTVARCCEIQMIEWHALFQYSFDNAVAA